MLLFTYILTAQQYRRRRRRRRQTRMYTYCNIRTIYFRFLNYFTNRRDDDRYGS